MNVFRFLTAALIACAVGFAAGGQVALAQDDLTETFVMRDGGLRLRHAPNWRVEEDAGVVYLQTPSFFVALYSPASLADMQAVSLRAAARSFIQSTTDTDFDPLTEVTLNSGKTALRAEAHFDSQPPNTTAFLLAFEAYGERAGAAGSTYVLMLVGGDSATVTDTAYALADTVEVGAFSGVEPTREPLFYLDLGGGSADDWHDVLAALQAVDLAADEGKLVFEAEMSSTSLGGVLNVSDDSESTYPNFAGGGLVSFRPEDQTDNVCGFLVRLIQGEERFRQFLFIGVDAADNLLIIDYDADNPNAPTVTREPSGVVFYQPEYLFYALKDNRLTVFVNGGAVIAGLPVNLPEPNADGQVAPSLAGAELEYSCVMTSAWTYGFER